MLAHFEADRQIERAIKGERPREVPRLERGFVDPEFVARHIGPVDALNIGGAACREGAQPRPGPASDVNDARRPRQVDEERDDDFSGLSRARGLTLEESRRVTHSQEYALGKPAVIGAGPVVALGRVERAFVHIVAFEPQYLDLVFAGLSRQTRRPDHVVLACDTDRADLGEAAQRWVSRVGAPISWVRRAHHGVARLPQVRNNSVRHLIGDLGHTRGRLIQIDADIICERAFVEKHLDLGRRAEMVYGYRVNLTEPESARLDPELIASGQHDPPISARQAASLRRRQMRARRHLIERALRLAPPHRPKLLGCNFSAPLEIWRRLNGQDELFQGWGYSDDEFARRAHLAGARCAPAASRIIAWHLYHPTRQPDGPMTSNPNHARFRQRGLPIVAERGLTNPIEQHPVEVTIFEP